ncbi:Failed axon connections homolog [Seminavis robusta]|uniref:Failed axon connections homolog n=1 Tax=Seminavis robusta TaxID=568900 RepID=A0A9N8E1L3_9STRA|nr:Failed axon connections homolog [Seminavis robusta]|eukprot:Sro560_g166600.1 Failed axon connections homolog (308) ;mRNA; r:6673-7596
MILITSYKDFLYGVAATLTAVAVYQIRAFLYVEPCSEIQRKAKLPIPLLPKDSDESVDSIIVWGFQKRGEYPAFERGVCDGSPYVARVECYLRLLGMHNYTKRVSVDLSENPRQKLPFCNLHGRMVDDSAKILEAIQALLKIDEGLTPDQLRDGHFLRRLLTGSLYWVRYSMNFGTEEGRQAVVEEMKKGLPAPLVPFISAMVIKSQQANLFGQGTGRMPFDEIIAMGEADLRAIHSLLGDRTYILGTDKATVFDTDLYAFMGHLFYDTTPSSMEWVQEIKRELPQLEQYTDRMRSLLFPELKSKTS